MKRVLLSAFACMPNHGSELGNGWNWAIGLANQGFEVHCITRGVGKDIIEAIELPENLIFHYVSLPLGLEKFYSLSIPTMYVHYLLWQWLAYKLALKLNRSKIFDVAHHVSWGSLQLGSFMYKLNIPFYFGPAGGGQKSPESFKNYFGSSWSVEKKREKISKLLLKYNPACRKMLNKANSIWVSNPDTGELIQKQGAKNYHYTLDAALPLDFFPENFIPKKISTNGLKLLWVGRLMPRKGIMLVLDVMENLKKYSNITLTVVGDGEQKDEFINAIKNKGLLETVNWKGTVPFEQVKEFYQNHDVFFFTSLRDSCPAQLIEAMAYGMPIVTLNLHGQAIIVNDETGYRTEVTTPQNTIIGLKNSILKLYNNPEEVAKMSNAAYEFALQQTWSNKIKNITNESYNVFSSTN